MIISVSRRTDIPALYPEWFVNRLRAGEVLVPNPYNRKKVSRISLSPDTVDCIAFWTKNPQPLLPYLKEIDSMGYNYYFQMTITGYEEDLESNIPGTEESMATFLLLSEEIGKERIDWRYDPVLLTDKYTINYHFEKFEQMCEWLHQATTRCIISFVDNYKESPFLELEEEDMRELGKGFAKIAKKYGLPLYTCAEKIDLSEYGILHGACIDKERIRKLIGYKLDLKKDSGQRRECGCAESVDIGIYDTCIHGCKYCYANGRKEGTERKYAMHDPKSPLMIGNLRGDEVIREKAAKSNRDYQLSLFDPLGTEFF